MGRTKKREIIVIDGYSPYYAAYVSGALKCKLSLLSDYVAEMRGHGYDDVRIAEEVLDELDNYANRVGGLIVLSRGTVE